MDILSLDIKWLILILLAINFLGITVLVNSEERFWLPAVFLWVLLFSSLILFNSINDISIEKKEIIYYDQRPTGDNKNETITEEAINDARKQANNEKIILLRLCGFQTFFTFLCLVIGYKKTGRKQYRSGVIIFFILTMVYVVSEILLLINAV